MNPQPSKARLVPLLVFFPLALVGFLCLPPLRQHLQRRDADRTVELLRPLVAADARFSEVTVSRNTKDRAFLAGEVGSSEDLLALHYLVVQAHPPQMPGFAVRFPVPSGE